MTTKFDFIQQDKRIMEQQLRRHQLSKSEHQKHLKTLGDDAELGETLYVCPEETDETVEAGSETTENS